MRRGLLALALLGCTPEPGSAAAPEPSPPTAAQTTFVPAVGTSAPPASGPLFPIAFREGAIELARWDDQAFALIDGEPIPLSPGRVVAREPARGVGLAPDKRPLLRSHELVAFAGEQLVYAEHLLGAGSHYFHYAREGDRWVAQPLPRRGGELQIETHYRAFVATGGALLGLRRHVLRSELWDFGDPDDPDTQAQLQKLGRTLAKLERGFVVLAGQLDAVPRLPKGMDARAAVATRSGELVALGYRYRVEVDDEDGPARLLSWTPGEAAATIAELPGLVDPAIHELSLWASGDVVLIGGLRELPGPKDLPYLAIREPDGEVHELALELPIPIHERVASATMTEGGELWIVTGAWNYASEAPCNCLWRKPVDEPWQGVALEPVELFRDAEPRWAHVHAEQTWIEIPAITPRRLYPAARTVLAANGAVWVGAELGPSYPGVDPILGDPRTVLLATVEVPAASELIPGDRLYDERVDRRMAAAQLTPGSDDCQTFTMVLADDPDGEGRDALTGLLASLEPLRDAATIEREDGWASASMIYVGELDGRAQLVVEANAWNPKSAAALADAFAQVLGRPPSLDCRPRAMLRAIERLR